MYYGRGFIFMIVSWVAMFIFVPLLGVILGDRGPVGYGHEGLPPLFYVVGFIAGVLIIGSNWLQRSVAANLNPSKTSLERFADNNRLTVEQDPESKKPMLRGKRGDVWLSIYPRRRAIKMEVRHNAPLPRGFSITSGKGGSSFANPILDGALQMTGGDKVDINWNDPRLTELLMAVLHPFPGSTIDHARITVSGAGMKQDDLPGHIDTVVDLIQILKAPPQRADAPPTFPGT
ncbi:MAG: hypothetical protein AAFV53_35600 [Myxococcota bacterium]